MIRSLLLPMILLAVTAHAAPPDRAGGDRANRGQHRPPGPEVGDTAPDFTLKQMNSDETVQLSERLGQDRPVVLVFGSYT